MKTSHVRCGLDYVMIDDIWWCNVYKVDREKEIVYFNHSDKDYTQMEMSLVEFCTKYMPFGWEIVDGIYYEFE